MKKRIIYSLAAFAVATLSLTSCEDMFGDYLDKQPSNDLTGEQVFSDWALLRQFHYDTYNFPRHGALRINNSWLDAATDLAEVSFAGGGVKSTFNIGNYYGGAGANELTGTWEVYYRGIRKCNMVLEKIDDVPQPADMKDDLFVQEKRWFINEARYLRAWMYWELFLRYGAIPVITDVLEPSGDIISNYVDRPTIKQYVVEFIMRELAECEDGLMSYADGKTAQYASRISQPMASALYSRIAIYMASPRYSAESGITWQDALDAVENFESKYGSFYKLIDEPENRISGLTHVWAKTQYSENNTEIIMYRNEGTIGWGQILQDSPVGDGGNGGNCPSQNLVDMYDMIDGQAPFVGYDVTGAPLYNGVNPTINEKSGYAEQDMWKNRDLRLYATVLYHGCEWGGEDRVIDVRYGQSDNPIGNANSTPTGYYMCKYIPEQIVNDRNHTGKGYRNWTIMRYAEILLNKAEILNELNGPTAEVCQLLDQIRHRAGITGNVADRDDLKSKEAMRNFIHKERTIELAFEEQRPWDVRRWSCAVEALSRDIIGVDVDNDGKISRKVAQKRVFEEKMYLYPIPEAEYWKTGIKNNPGWE